MESGLFMTDNWGYTYSSKEVKMAGAHLTLSKAVEVCNHRISQAGQVSIRYPWIRTVLIIRHVKFSPKSGPGTEPAPRIFWMGTSSSSPAFISGPSIEPGSTFIPLALVRSCWAQHEPSRLTLGPQKVLREPSARPDVVPMGSNLTNDICSS